MTKEVLKFNVDAHPRNEKYFMKLKRKKCKGLRPTVVRKSLICTFEFFPEKDELIYSLLSKEQ